MIFINVKTDSHLVLSFLHFQLLTDRVTKNEILRDDPRLLNI